MPETTEQQPANTKPKQSAYLVCEGAQCTCNRGTTPSTLKVDSHKKAYINNDKLLATEKDINFELKATTFGTCSLLSPQKNDCAPVVVQWIKPYNDIEVEGKKVITDMSELLCTIGGTITIDTHGQKQDVSEAQADNMDKAIAMQVNPLANLFPLKTGESKTVKVKSIKGILVEDPKYKTVGSQKAVAVVSITDKNIKDPADIYARPGQEIKFTAVYEHTEALVCWKLKGKEAPKYFLQHGSVFQTSFADVGKYTVEGYGTGNDDKLDQDTQLNVKKESIKRPEYSECMLDILVQVNRLTGIRHVSSDNVVGGKVDEKIGVHVRIGVPVTFEPVYLMPPNQEEIDHLILLIKDASGNEIQRSKGKPNIIFAAQNSAAVYSVEAYFDNSDAKPFIYPFKTAANTISVIAASGLKKENDKIRPGTTLTFSVSQFKFENDEVQEELIQAELANIKWYDNADTPAATGTTTYSNIYQREEKYVVTCAVTTKSAGWFTTKKNEADDWHFEVTRNYPTAIEQKTEGKVKVGKKVVFEMKSIFDVIYADEKTIHWELSGPESMTLVRLNVFVFTPKEKGKYTLTVSMNGKSKEFLFECIACEIVQGWWTDGDGNILTGNNAYYEPSNTIGFAGWGQEVVATFKHIGLKGEEVTLEVWDSDAASNTSVFTKDIKIEDDYSVGCAITLDEKIRAKVKEKGLTSDGALYFTVKAKNGLSVINSGMSLPENGKFLNVDSTPRVRAYFSDNNDTRRYSTAALDTPVYMQIKSTNMIGEELEIELWSLNSSLSPLASRFTFSVDKYGMASLKLNMKAIEPKLPTDKDSIMVYLDIYHKKTGHRYFTGSDKPKLTMYRRLLSSPASIGTTKAFVVVDVGGGEKRESMEIIFPLLTKPENDTENKWGETYYWGGSIASNQATYNSNRSGNRKHAARDLYTTPFTTVVAICDGEVLEINDFYCMTHQVTIKHKTDDGREFIIRYGEIDPNSITIKKGDKVMQNQPIGKTGKLLEIDKEGNQVPLMTLNGSVVYMLHFEYYSGTAGLNLTKPLTDRNNLPFQRRNDMKDPLAILLEGYKNSFQNKGKHNNRLSPQSMITSQKGIQFIIDWEKFEPLPYDDPKFCTIGYGHLIKKDLCKNIDIPKEFKNGITKDAAVKLFKKDLETFENAVKREIKVNLYQYEFDALVSLLYNSGEYFLSIGGPNKTETMIKKLINKEDYIGGITEFLDVTNKNEPGLIKRRNAEFKMFTNNIYDSSH